MSLSDLNKKTIIENLIKQKIQNKESINTTLLQYEIEDTLANYDLDSSLFDQLDYKVEVGEEISAGKLNNTFSTIQQDLANAYIQLAEEGNYLTSQAHKQMLELDGLEREILRLEKKINSLYYATKENRKVYIWDENFADSSNISLSHDSASSSLSSEDFVTDAFYDFKAKQITLNPTSSDRIYLNTIDEEKDISFKVLNTTDFINKVDLPNTKLINLVKQENIFWQTKIYMSKNVPVNVELWIKLGDESATFNKIFISLLSLLSGSDLIVTPLYSIDNINYYQLPSDSYSKIINTATAFHCKAIEAKYLKLLLTKISADYKENGAYVFEFGFKEINLWNNIYSTEIQYFVSKRIFHKNPVTYRYTINRYKNFIKSEIEVCKEVPENTNLKLYFPLIGATDYFNDNFLNEISPKNNPDNVNPTTVINNTLDEYTISGEISIRQAGEVFNNEQEIYSTNYLAYNLSNAARIASSPISVLDKYSRYSLLNYNDRILNCEFTCNPIGDWGFTQKPWLSYSRISIFRNIGTRGLDELDSLNYVRGNIKGWALKDSYYQTTIYIDNNEGLELDFGNNEIIIDEKAYKGKVSSAILTGKSVTNTGIHTIKIHKDLWSYIPRQKNTLDELKSVDPFYPHNCRYLIEGYEYGPGYTEERVYIGATLFAEYLMTRIDPYNFLYNIQSDQYQYFTLDIGNNAGFLDDDQVLVVKSDVDNFDYENEDFYIVISYAHPLEVPGEPYFQFNDNYTTTLFALFSTTDPTVTPVLESYRVIMEALDN